MSLSSQHTGKQETALYKTIKGKKLPNQGTIKQEVTSSPIVAGQATTCKQSANPSLMVLPSPSLCNETSARKQDN